MIIYRFRHTDRVFDGAVEIPDGPTIPPFHTRAAPPEREGYHAVMRGGWALVEGPAPDERSPEPQPEPDPAVSVRSDRDARLSATDWIVIRSVERGEPVPEDWIVYRQALRDITLQEGFPRDVAWPVKPE